jgi:ribosome-binding protein aMBF1 (putative translation factor)
MMKINFDLIESERKRVGMSRAELARRVGREEDTLLKFFRSGKKLTDHLNLISKICKELGIKLYGKDGVIR